MAAKHTPGPWKILPEEDGVPYIRIRGAVIGSRWRIANVLFPDYDGAPDSEIQETRENARRIVACLNACRGIPTDKLEQMSIFDLIAEAEQRAGKQ